MRSHTARLVCGATLLGVVLAAPVAAGASAQPLSAGTRQTPVSSIDKSKAMPTADRAAIDTAAAAFLANSIDKAPGLWLAVWDPKKGYYQQAYGSAVLPNTPASVKDHFYIGSITKTVFATGVLQQVGSGKLALSDTVKGLDPALAKKFPKAAKYTVAQLIGMQTQLPDYADAAVEIMMSDPKHRFTRDELITLAFAKGKAIPATGGYSTTNIIIMGEILAKVTGRTPESLVNGVFRQAGMTQSRLPVVSRPLPAPAAHGYLGAVAAAQYSPANPGLTETTDVATWPLDWGREGGGAYSTIGDLATWGGTCLGNSLLPASTVKKRLVFNAIDAGKYGLGIIKQGGWLAHSGQAIGYTANVACNPQTGAVVAYAVNSTFGTFDLNSAIAAVAFPEYDAAQK